MEVLVFGPLSDIIGSDRYDEPGITNTDQLRKHLLDIYPSMALVPFTVAVNNQIIHENTSLTKNDRVALLPPFSGG